ncbi:hypothetical protein [Sodalis endosymbiont of Henestaris halophilus]|uniref:hypothetical protein n=1 Tax=Sodalis endosymbiont of Henestaris halophilus TaxID=1929246 RepID=UPI0012FD54BA|nr:hypothetical protein [Sodalis endosymbiont of Henestaris halophilus]
MNNCSLVGKRNLFWQQPSDVIPLIKVLFLVIGKQATEVMLSLASYKHEVNSFRQVT